MPETDLALLIAAAQSAGDIARAYVPGTAKTWDKPGGAGPVTEADLAVNDHLHDVLRAARPGYGWLSEETEDDPARLGCDCTFIIDPIDGTRSFVEGSNTWAHSLAVARGGQITAGVVYLPLREKLYAASLGGGATLNGDPITVSRADDLNRATVMAARPLMEPQHWSGPVPGFKRAFRPSLAYRLGLVGQGRFDAMLTLRKSWEWDIAAGALIVSEAGGRITDRSGAPLLFNNGDPRLNGVVGAGPALHTALIGALSAA
ncbi:MAG: inositol monophosphatase family protein [Sulfitobacter sp.]